MAEITWTRESEVWLKDIFDYIAADDPGAAARTVIAIYEKAQLLRNHPRRGHKYEMVESREVRILLRQDKGSQAQSTAQRTGVGSLESTSRKGEG